MARINVKKPKNRGTRVRRVPEKSRPGVQLVDGPKGTEYLRAAVERPTFDGLKANGVRKMLAFTDQLQRERDEARALLQETIDTFYMNDDGPMWTETGLGGRIASHLGLKCARATKKPRKRT